MVPQILSFWNKLSNGEQTSHCLVMMRERPFFPSLLYQLSAHTSRLKHPELATEKSMHRLDRAASLHAFLLHEEDVWLQARLTENMVNWCIKEQYISKQCTVPFQKPSLSLTLRVRN